MKRFLILSCALFFAFQFSVLSQTVISQTRTSGWALPKNDFSVMVYGAIHSASSLYDKDGKLIAAFHPPEFTPEYKDSAGVGNERYTTDFTGYTGGLYAEYGVFKGLTATLDIPITQWSLEERYSYDSTYGTPKVIQMIRRDRGSFVRTQPNYYGIGARYAWTYDSSLVGFSGTVRVPPGFNEDNVSDEFLSDGALEGIVGMNLGLNFDRKWVATSLRYAMRAEDFKDEFQIYSEFGLRTVPGTQFVVFLQYVQSAGSYQDVFIFEPRQSRFQENFFLAGGTFDIELKKLILKAGYEIRLAGKNTWALSTFSVGVGYRLGEL